MSASKKIFIISSAILAFALIFLGIYNLAFKKPASKEAQNAAGTAETSQSSAMPSFYQAKSSLIIDAAVLSPIIDPAKSAIKYYSKDTGKAYQVDFDGSNKKTLSDQSLPGLTDVFWSPDTNKVITKFTKENGNKFFFYDYATSKGVPLKDNLDTVYWQNNNKILYKYFDPKTQARTLNVADPDGSNWIKIADLNYRFISAAPIPRTALVSFWNYPDAANETALESVPILTGEARTISKGNFGADYLWNGSGNLILSSHSNQKNGSKIELAIMNDKGGEFKNLNIPTFVSKVVWSKDNKTIYYALPESLPDNMTLPNDYMSGKFNTSDSFWKLNTATGEKKQLIAPDKLSAKTDASNLMLNADESSLFFLNKLDDKLYRLDL